MYPYFLLNYNLTMLLIFVPILIGLILFVLSRSWKPTLAKYWPLCIGQYAFNGVMFSAYIVWVSIGLQFMFGIKDLSSGVGVVSLIFSIFFILVYIAYSVLFILKPDFFGQFVDFFSDESFNKKTYLILIVERIGISIGLTVMLFTVYSPIMIIVVYSIMLICQILKRPYKETRHNIRQICNFVIVIAIQIIYLIYNTDTVINQSKIQSYSILPIVVCSLLVVCVIYSAVALGY